VTHRSRRRGRRLPVALTLVGLIVAGALTACTDGAATASFDPAAGCPSEGRAPGAYPDLEARIPMTYEGRRPDQLDSGRHCDAASLGSLAAAGFDEVRFAGGAWDLGGYRAVALVVFEAPGLTADQVADFYATSARAASRTQVTGESTPEIVGRPGHRLDSITGDRTQTVVTWPSGDDGVVNVVLTNDLPDAKIQVAIDAFGGR
jgi:hypothetical protein